MTENTEKNRKRRREKGQHRIVTKKSMNRYQTPNRLNEQNSTKQMKETTNQRTVDFVEEITGHRSTIVRHGTHNVIIVKRLDTTLKCAVHGQLAG